MEPEVVEFLRRVGKTILIALLWLAINAVAAIKGDNAFVGDHITVWNVAFYIWFAISVWLLIYLIKRLWDAPVKT